jgi:hypothetical protein
MSNLYQRSNAARRRDDLNSDHKGGGGHAASQLGVPS